MRKFLLFLFLGFAVQFGLSAISGAHEVYMARAERMQPDGTRFIGTEWDNDHFYYEYETMEGYKYVFDPLTGYYCYAVLDHRGEYVSSGLKVGIDDPAEHGIPKGLQRTPARMAEIRREMERWGYVLQEESRLAKIAVQTPPDSMTLAVVLVEFQDVKHRTNPSAYTRQNFEDMLFGNYTGTSPDGETVYGSVAQYYNEMSGGDFVLTKNGVNGGAAGGVLNGGGSVPTWLTLPNNKAYYTNSVADTFFAHAQSAATSAGLNVTTSTTRKVVYIYAGNQRRDGNGGLIPQVDFIGGTKYQISERTDTNPTQYYRDGETPPTGTTTFTHIGTHAHELGHILGLYHPGSTNALDWCLMQGGSIGGPRIGSCPWPLNPFYRVDLGWLTLQDVTSATIGQQISAGTSNAYRITGKNNYHYILEHKNKQGFTQYVKHYGFSSAPGLFIWRKHATSGSPYLVVADGSRGRDSQSDFFGDPFPGNTNNQNISDYTTINLKPSASSYPRIGLFNIVNNTTYTSVDVYLNYWEATVSSNTTWSGEVYVGGDVTVSSGATLTIQPGSTVKFLANSDKQSGGRDASRSELIVHGKLTAEGTSANPIAFQSTNGGTTKDEWYGIVFESDADDASSVKYANIKNAQYAVYCDNASPDIEHNTITYSTIGVKGVSMGSGGSISYNTINNTTTAVSLASNSSVPVNYNNLSSNVRSGYFTGTTSTVQYDTLNSNSNEGISLFSGSDVTFGHNRIIGNTGWGM